MRYVTLQVHLNRSRVTINHLTCSSHYVLGDICSTQCNITVDDFAGSSGIVNSFTASSTTTLPSSQPVCMSKFMYVILYDCY